MLVAVLAVVPVVVLVAAPVVVPAVVPVAALLLYKNIIFMPFYSWFYSFF